MSERREDGPRINTDKHGLKHEALTEKIIGAFFEVYNELGYGFLESVYERALVHALTCMGLRTERQKAITILFRGVEVGTYKCDLVVDDSVVVETKSARAIDSAHEAQLLNYLRATELEVGLLLNFGSKPEFRRLLFDNDRKKIRVNPCKSVALSRHPATVQDSNTAGTLS
jgi:GxxExxY protein